MNNQTSQPSTMNISIKAFMNKTRNTRSLLIIYGYMREYIISIGYNTLRQLPESLNYNILIFYQLEYIIYGIGRQESGEFGFGKHESQKHGFIRLIRFENFLVSSPYRIYRGKERLMIINDLRKLYSAGFNERGECGVDSSRYKITNLTQCTFNINDDKLFVNLVNDGIWSNTTICKLSNGDYYGFGINHHGEFGNNFKSYSFENVPKKLTFLTKFFKNINIIKIASGFEHTLFLTSNGILYSCGNNDAGQCGIEQQPNNTCNRFKQFISPQILIFKQDKKKKKKKNKDNNDKDNIENEYILDMSCGEDFNLVKTQKNELYVFGNNVNGQLGMGRKSKRFYNKPVLHNLFNIDNKQEIDEIDCGRIHSAIINKKGIVFLFGYNGYGQIGNGKVNDWNDGIKIPHCFQTMHDNYKNLKIKQISLGSNHTVMLTQNNNRIITFGGNDHKQCSPHDNNQKILFPHFLLHDEIGLNSAEEYQRIMAGTKTTIVILAKHSGKQHYGF